MPTPGDFSPSNKSEPSDSCNRAVSIRSSSRIQDLGRGVVWCCCPLERGGFSEEVDDLATTIASMFPQSRVNAGETKPDLCQVLAALRGPAIGMGDAGQVLVITPEESEAFGFAYWDGDGHYQMAKYGKVGLPTLGQIIAVLQMVDAAIDKNCWVILRTSTERRGTGAVLAGAMLVLSRLFSAESAWSEMLKENLRPSSDPARAWDRYPQPFSDAGMATSSSVTVLDCLCGLEFARDHQWFGSLGYRKFDVSCWLHLRKKFDASPIIPGKMFAMANPAGTAQNPAFPGLLSPPDKRHPQPAKAKADSEPALGQDTDDMLELEKRLAQAGAWIDQQAGEDYEEDFFTPSMAAIVVDFRKRRHRHPHSPSLKAAEPSLVPEFESASTLCSSSEATDSAYSPATTLQSDSQTSSATFLDWLLDEKVDLVVRLNHASECPDQCVHTDLFEAWGISTVDHAFEDGGVPTQDTVQKFLDLCSRHNERSDPILAVHCMAGLGRTGVLIGAYAVRCLGMSSTAFHGWVRLCRPGSIQTHRQETWLRELQPSIHGDFCLSPPESPGPSPGRKFRNKLKNLWNINVDSPSSGSGALDDAETPTCPAFPHSPYSASSSISRRRIGNVSTVLKKVTSLGSMAKTPTIRRESTT